MRALFAGLGVAAVLGACSPPPDSLATGDGDHGPRVDARAPRPERRVVILLIGDGMGPGQLAAASHYRSGAAGALFLESLPSRGHIRTASPTGITDSSAAATVMATGHYTHNGAVGLDRDGEPVESLVELAERHGLATGLVTTTELTHATPASFAAHVPSRNQASDIAAQMAELAPDVLLGGGAKYFEGRGDGRDLTRELAGAGYQVVRGAAELRAAAAPTGELLGLFADGHLPYVVDRAEDADVPDLAEMAMSAIAVLDRDPDGFFLMIEGGRIDHASHANQLERAIGETLAFDDAVRAVADWAEGQPEVTVLVTADHETGGLEVVAGAGAGALPAVTWRWGQHTNASVIAAGLGPGSERFDGARRDHRWIHAVAAARITGRALREPPPVIIADGDTADLSAAAALQARASDATPLRLDRLAAGADAYGLGVGVEGVFSWRSHAVIVLVDLDHGAGTGVRAFDGSLGDFDAPVDRLLSSLRLTAPPDRGWGADLALVSMDGLDPKVTQRWLRAGLRGLRAPWGKPEHFGIRGVAMNYGDGVRTRGELVDPIAGRGFEAFVPWSEIGAPGAGARIAVMALLVSEDGQVISNQALPPFPVAGSHEPSAAPALPPPLAFEP